MESLSETQKGKGRGRSGEPAWEGGEREVSRSENEERANPEGEECQLAECQPRLLDQALQSGLKGGAEHSPNARGVPQGLPEAGS